MNRERRAIGPVLAVAGAVWVVVALYLALAVDVRVRFGDTDDVMRLVIVRDLAGGRGWYDQLVTRLAPPGGTIMHWSRLIDGGLAGLLIALRQVFAPATAEWLMRVVWPLLWILPALAAALAMAVRLGGRRALLFTSLIAVVSIGLYLQFLPGRIDHHNVQIVMCLIALAGSVLGRGRGGWGLLAGAGAAAGLAVGLEALPLQVIAGAGFALTLLVAPERWRDVFAYGAGLAITVSGLFLVQTPPGRWGLAVCDALGVNLVAGLAVTGSLLALTAVSSRRWTVRGRLVALCGVGIAGAGVYLALEPSCLHGPFASVDPFMRRTWLAGVQELQPVWRVWAFNRNAAIEAGVAAVVGVVSLAALALNPGARSRELLVVGAATAVAIVMGLLAWRMSTYASWLVLVVSGAALARLASGRPARTALALLLVVVASPTLAGRPVEAIASRLSPGPTQAPRIAAQEGCFAPSAYQALARLPAGTVLSEIDMGSYVLAFTSHRALSAPYHRTSMTLAKAQAAWSGPSAEAPARLAALGADYVVDCPAEDLATPPGSLAAALRAGRDPAGLRRLSPRAARLRIWRVEPVPTLQNGRKERPAGGG